MEEYSRSLLARSGRHICPPFRTETGASVNLLAPVLRTLPRSHGLVHGIQDTDEASDDVWPAQKTSRLGECFHVLGSGREIRRHASMCAGLWRHKHERHKQQPQFSSWVHCTWQTWFSSAVVRPRKWQLASPPPSHQPSTRLLLWQIQETPVRTRSNAARFSGSLTHNPSPAEAHTHVFQTLRWLSIVVMVSSSKKQQHLREYGFASGK